MSSRSSRKKPIRVVFVAGVGRSGTTILGSYIGNHIGFLHIGELAYIFSRGLIGNWKQSNGESFAESRFWSPVKILLEEVVAERGIDFWVRRERLLRFTSKFYFICPCLIRLVNRSFLNIYRDVVSLLACSQKDIILVDTSKYALLADMILQEGGSVIWSKRNLSDLFRSYRSVKSNTLNDPKIQHMPIKGPVGFSISILINYASFNTLTFIHRGVDVIRFDEFIKDTDCLKRLRFSKKYGRELLIEHEGYVDYRKSVAFQGNPSRFGGKVKIGH